MTVVLDSSAALALAFGEPGADIVAAALNGATICTVNESEVLTGLVRSGATIDQAQIVMAGLEIAAIAFDSGLAAAAARLFPATRRAGLSLGDRCCLALAERLHRPVLTADRGWRSIAGVVPIEIRLIR